MPSPLNKYIWEKMWQYIQLTYNYTCDKLFR